ncbi:MAG TPA: hypothetical protein VK555_08085 [Terriglobales bacterium]|nr:hypothetical protein [Terriglobales bacterium]
MYAGAHAAVAMFVRYGVVSDISSQSLIPLCVIPRRHPVLAQAQRDTLRAFPPATLPPTIAPRILSRSSHRRLD